MAESARNLDRDYTFSDWLQWPGDERWEIVGGDGYAMAPPSPRHQMVAHGLAVQLERHFRRRRCRVMQSPVGVRLSAGDVVQPDLVVVCNEKQIRPTHIDGPPALVVEIVSPSSTVHDRVRKTALYARAGVKEFWLVTPWPSMVEVLVLRRGSYAIEAVFEKSQVLRSPTFSGLKLKLSAVFDFPLEPHELPPVVKEPPYPYGSRPARVPRSRRQ